MKTHACNDMLPILNKVPQVTFVFWAIKIMATTVGETAADFLNFDLNFGLTGTSVLTSVLLAIFLTMQLRARYYVPWLYWINVVLISIAGTLITDNLVDNAGVSLEASTTVFSLALIATFAAWYWSQKTLSIHTIHTRQRELFYWLAILFTFALGTAAGDLAAEGMHLGYAHSALMFGALIVFVTIAYALFGANAILAFWIAYVLTRPLGASCGDLLAQPVANGGLGLGAITTSAAFLSGILVLVGFVTIRNQRHVVTIRG